MKRIYVAGPYTHGDVAVNVRTAMEAGLALIQKYSYFEVACRNLEAAAALKDQGVLFRA